MENEMNKKKKKKKKKKKRAMSWELELCVFVNLVII
jgi:hypothetical protein